MGGHVLTNLSLLGVHTRMLVSMNLCAYIWEEQKSGWRSSGAILFVLHGLLHCHGTHRLD